MHKHQLITWTTHTEESTTLLDYKKLYTYMCNIVTEFYLYSIVCIYLINSTGRLDVTYSVRHHFRMKLYQNLGLNDLIGHLDPPQMAVGHLKPAAEIDTFTTSIQHWNYPSVELMRKISVRFLFNKHDK